MEIFDNDKFYDLLVHSTNVSIYSILLGNQLKLDNIEIKILKIGGLLHDIGKFLIPEKILNKNTPLTNKEFKIIKKHPIIGELLLQNYFPDEIKKIVRNHHERMDGKGYPDRLKDDIIPYYVKIITICDAFDAMTSERIYNKVKTLDEALNELYRCSIPITNEKGELIQQFDTYLVNIFVKTIKDNKLLVEYFNDKDMKIMNKRKNKEFYLH